MTERYSTEAVACGLSDVAGWLENEGWISKHVRQIRLGAERLRELEAELVRLREEWAQEGIGWLRDKDIDRLMGVEAENERLRAAVDMVRSRLTAIRNGEAFQPHLHAAAGLDEINDLLASA